MRKIKSLGSALPGWCCGKGSGATGSGSACGTRPCVLSAHTCALGFPACALGFPARCFSCGSLVGPCAQADGEEGAIKAVTHSCLSAALPNLHCMMMHLIFNL